MDCDEQSVTFRYTPSKAKTAKTRQVTGEKFVHGFLQHVLPRGFQKVRHYGWMSSNCRIKSGPGPLAGVALSGLDLLAGQRPAHRSPQDYHPPVTHAQRCNDE